MKLVPPDLANRLRVRDQALSPFGEEIRVDDAADQIIVEMYVGADELFRRNVKCRNVDTAPVRFPLEIEHRVRHFVRNEAVLAVVAVSFEDVFARDEAFVDLAVVSALEKLRMIAAHDARD